MERKFTDDEIVKALRGKAQAHCAVCDTKRIVPCENCVFHFIRLALDLINRQKAEIERLSDRNHKCIYLSDEETTGYCVDGPCPKFKTEAQIRAEAIKKFAERMKKEVDGWYYDFANIDDTMDALNDIDNLAKEMTGENNGN